MSTASFLLTPELAAYVGAHSDQPDAVLADLAEETKALGEVARMQIAPEQGALLQVLTAAIGARHAVEVGTFTGYSSVCIARGLAEGGRLVCCDVSEEWTAVARRAWARAGLEDRVELRLGPAAETLEALPADPPIDLAFIDADKGGYLRYYEALLARLRPGGLVLVDNVLWGGRVVDPDDHDADTEAIRAFNDHVAADERVERVLVPIADGLLVVRKR